MSKYNVIGIVICFIMLVACRKGDNHFTISGAITDQTFGGNLTNCSIYLYEVEPGASDSVLISSTTSADGTYSFTFDRRKVEEYLLKVYKTNYFSLSKHIPFGDLTVEEDNVFAYGTTAKAWVRLHFVNSNPLPGDQINFIKQAGKINCDECCSMEQQFIFGPIADTSIYCINDGNATYSLIWSDPVNGMNGVESVTTIAFDTTEILITY